MGSRRPDTPVRLEIPPVYKNVCVCMRERVRERERERVRKGREERAIVCI